MQCATGVVQGELPTDGGLLLVPGGLPGGDFGDERVAVADPTIEALASEHRELQLGHVQPSAVDRGVVEVELSEEPARLVRSEKATALVLHHAGCDG